MKKLKILSFIILVTISISFTINVDKKKFDFGIFRIETPIGWTSSSQTLTDSFFGSLTNGKDSLYFSYGSNLKLFDNVNPKLYYYLLDTINGLASQIRIPKISGNGSIRLDIWDINCKDKFYIVTNKTNQTNDILQIFKSILFKESDSTINPKLTVEKFYIKTVITSKTLFIQNCASCHSKNLMLIGPALNKEFLEFRSKKWLSTFFFERRKLQNDKLYLESKEKFKDMSCMTFKKSEKQNILKIIAYLKDE